MTCEDFRGVEENGCAAIGASDDEEIDAHFAADIQCLRADVQGVV